MAADALYFLAKIRFCVPAGSRTSKPCSRSQVTASSYVRCSFFFPIFTFSGRQTTRGSFSLYIRNLTVTVAYWMHFGQHYRWADRAMAVQKCQNRPPLEAEL